MRGFFAGLGLLVAGVFMGGLAGWAVFGGRLSDTDRELRELGDISRAIADYRERVEQQAGLVDGRLSALGGGLSEVKELAGRATGTSGSLVAALKELVGNLKEISTRVQDMENNYNLLRREYSRLRDIVADQSGWPVAP